MRTRYLIQWSLLGLFVVCRPATAAPLVEVPIGDRYLDAEYVVGSGSNLSIFVVDFEATGGDSYAFGIRWNTAIDLGTALLDIAGPEANSLVADVTIHPTFGVLINNFLYSGDAGEPDNFWRLEIGTYSPASISWEGAGTGLSSLESIHFSDPPTFDPETFTGTAGFVGFYNSFDDFNIKPRVPTVLLGDFDSDDNVDADDIDALCELIDSSNVAGDVNGDTVVDQDDMDYMIAAILGTAYGDADLDDDVDGADFDAWRIRDSLGGGIGWATGDFDCDGDVDGADFDLWRLRPTAIPGGEGPVSVPEPSSIVLLLVGLAGAWRARRSVHRHRGFSRNQ